MFSGKKLKLSERSQIQGSNWIFADRIYGGGSNRIYPEHLILGVTIEISDPGGITTGPPGHPYQTPSMNNIKY